MALTVTKKAVYVIGDRKEVIFDVTGDSSYLNAGAGNHGESLTAADLGLDELTFISGGPMVKSDFTSAFHASYDVANARLQVFKANGTTDLTPVANAVDLSTYTARLRAVGKGPAAV